MFAESAALPLEAPQPVERKNCACVVSGGVFYVSGGDTAPGVSDAHVYTWGASPFALNVMCMTCHVCGARVSVLCCGAEFFLKLSHSFFWFNVSFHSQEPVTRSWMGLTRFSTVSLAARPNLRAVAGVVRSQRHTHVHTYETCHTQIRYIFTFYTHLSLVTLAACTHISRGYTLYCVIVCASHTLTIAVGKSAEELRCVR